MATYVTLGQVKARLRITSTADDVDLQTLAGEARRTLSVVQQAPRDERLRRPGRPRRSRLSSSRPSCGRRANSIASAVMIPTPPRKREELSVMIRELLRYHLRDRIVRPPRPHLQRPTVARACFSAPDRPCPTGPAGSVVDRSAPPAFAHHAGVAGLARARSPPARCCRWRPTSSRSVSGQPRDNHGFSTTGAACPSAQDLRLRRRHVQLSTGVRGGRQ